MNILKVRGLRVSQFHFHSISFKGNGEPFFKKPKTVDTIKHLVDTIKRVSPRTSVAMVMEVHVDVEGVAQHFILILFLLSLLLKLKHILLRT